MVIFRVYVNLPEGNIQNIWENDLLTYGKYILNIVLTFTGKIRKMICLLTSYIPRIVHVPKYERLPKQNHWAMDIPKTIDGKGPMWVLKTFRMATTWPQNGSWIIILKRPFWWLK